MILAIAGGDKTSTNQESKTVTSVDVAKEQEDTMEEIDSNVPSPTTNNKETK